MAQLIGCDHCGKTAPPAETVRWIDVKAPSNKPGASFTERYDFCSEECTVLHFQEVIDTRP